MTVKEMREQRATLVHEARSHSDPATAARIWDQGDKIGERAAKAEQRTAWDAAFAGEPEARTDDRRFSSQEYRAAFRSFVSRGMPNYDTAEYRALSADNDVQGGYMRAPEQLAGMVIEALNTLAIRQLATKHTVATAESLGVPSVDTDPADADWTQENVTINEDTAMVFGKRELHPHLLTKAILASGKFCRRAVNGERTIASRLAYKFGVTEEKAFLAGDGASKPLGIFTASASGVTTARDVSTGNTSTAITMAGLVNCMYSLKDQYLRSPSVRWIFHRDAVKSIRLLRAEDGGADTGSYLWQPSTQAGQPDTLLGVPVISSEYAPATFTTGLYVGLIGDFSYYHVADSLLMSIQRLSEKYSATDQIAFLGRLETDGMPVLAEAFARVKLA